MSRLRQPHPPLCGGPIATHVATYTTSPAALRRAHRDACRDLHNFTRRFAAGVRKLAADRLGHQTLPDGPNARQNPRRSAVDHRGDRLQVRLELALLDRGRLDADAAQVLGLAAILAL